MKILIFGGNRFVGKLVTKQLYAAGHDITLINRTGSSPVPCSVIKCDRNDSDSLRSAIGDTFFDCVIDMCLYNTSQAVITTDILKNNTHKYIFISSIAVYDNTDIYPITESTSMTGTTTFGQYGLNKLAVEQYLDSIPNFPYINLRPAYILGKDNHIYREKYFFDCIINDKPINVSGDGNNIISIIFADDIANIITMLVTMDCLVRTTYNISSNEYITINGFIKLIASIVNKTLNINYNSSSTDQFADGHCIVSNEKIKQKIGSFNFQTLKQGLTEFYEYTY